jgi:CubicO group peptidase (beta-lactamase class C family)
MIIATNFTSAPAVAGQTQDRARIARGVDSIVAAALSGGRAAGMSVGVVRGHDTLVLKGYGSGDLELGVPTPAGAVYAIGSATKQFTAAAIMQLVEQGKLSLDDSLTKVLPGYPTQGHRVTVRRLLDHTSGIKNYTEISGFGAQAVRALPRDSMVAFFATHPFDFSPGEAMNYNNSAYTLLGLILEKVSGVSYDVYIKRHLFDRAGMPSSSYCSTGRIVPRRVYGYDVGQEGLRPAQYLDYGWPYAAGALCSTAGDLVAWLRALHGGKILGPAAYRELIAPGRLADGTVLRYAKGLAVDSVLGHAAVHHGGDIPGFATELTYLRDDSMTVVVLINTEGPVRPDEVTRSIVRFVLGDRSPAGTVFRGCAAAYVGAYRGVGREGDLFRVAADSAGGLTIQVGSGPARRLTYYGGETFGRGDSRFTFVRERGRVTRLRVDQVYGATMATRQATAVSTGECTGRGRENGMRNEE